MNTISNTLEIANTINDVTVKQSLDDINPFGLSDYKLKELSLQAMQYANSATKLFYSRVSRLSKGYSYTEGGREEIQEKLMPMLDLIGVKCMVLDLEDSCFLDELISEENIKQMKETLTLKYTKFFMMLAIRDRISIHYNNKPECVIPKLVGHHSYYKTSLNNGYMLIKTQDRKNERIPLHFFLDATKDIDTDSKKPINIKMWEKDDEESIKIDLKSHQVDHTFDRQTRAKRYASKATLHLDELICKWLSGKVGNIEALEAHIMTILNLAQIDCSVADLHDNDALEKLLANEEFNAIKDRLYVAYCEFLKIFDLRNRVEIIFNGEHVNICGHSTFTNALKQGYVCLKGSLGIRIPISTFLAKSTVNYYEYTTEMESVIE